MDHLQRLKQTYKRKEKLLRKNNSELDFVPFSGSINLFKV